MDASTISARQRARNRFFIDCQQEEYYPTLIKKIQYVRPWEAGNLVVKAELDAILGLAFCHLENKAEASVLLREVVGSNHASNADKVVANACMAILYMEKGDTLSMEAAMHEIDVLTCGYTASLWAARALGDLSEAFAKRKDFDDAKRAYDYAVDACERLKRSDDDFLRTEGANLMEDITFTYVTMVLIPQKKFRQAERYLALGAASYFAKGKELQVVLCQGYLGHIAFVEKRKEEAVLFQEKAWEIMKNHRNSEPLRFLDAGVVLWLLAENVGWGGDGYMLELFAKHGFEDPKKGLEAVHQRKILKEREAGCSHSDDHN